MALWTFRYPLDTIKTRLQVGLTYTDVLAICEEKFNLSSEKMCDFCVTALLPASPSNTASCPQQRRQYLGKILKSADFHSSILVYS